MLRVPVSSLSPGEGSLSESAARFATRVHRLGPGDRFVAFDPESATESEARIIEVSRRETRCVFSDPKASERVPREDITLYQALGKADKPEQVIRCATALAARAVVFVESAHVVARSAGRVESRRERFRKIAVEAARQCERGDLLRVEGPVPFSHALEHGAREPALGIVLDPDAEVGLGALLSSSWRGQALSLLIGPEGGFSNSEHAAARQAGFVPTRLGGFVLRTELAAAAALGAIAAMARDRGPGRVR